jgi:hypothetical protein
VVSSKWDVCQKWGQLKVVLTKSGVNQKWW